MNKKTFLLERCHLKKMVRMLQNDLIQTREEVWENSKVYYVHQYVLSKNFRIRSKSLECLHQAM